MQVISPNNVKIYNLSAGKSLPDVSILFCCLNQHFLLLNSNYLNVLVGKRSQKKGYDQKRPR